MDTQICPRCDGARMLAEQCPLCHGQPERNPDGCPLCEGDGRLETECPQCGGNGRLDDRDYLNGVYQTG